MCGNPFLDKRWVVILLSVAALLNGMLPVSTSAHAFRTTRLASAPAPAVSATTQARVRAAYGNLPMRFERNQGQMDKRVRFVARGAGYGLWLTDEGALLSLRSGESRASAASGGEIGPEQPGASAAQSTVIGMKLVKANRQAQARGEAEMPGRSNYFVGNDAGKWRAGVSNYAKVVYGEVYRGVDLVYYGKGGELEYDFKVAAGANPGAIGWRIEGAQGASVNGEGELVIRTAAGEMRQRRPVAYQEERGKRREVEARYEMRGKDEVGFAVGRYDRGKPLVIDPVLSYSTYLGGTRFDQINGIAVDAAGNAYLVGNTSSPDFPSSHSIGMSSSSDRPFFVAKLNAAGNALIYSTLISGFQNGFGSSSSGQAITLDAAGNAYVTGQTNALDFPITPGAFQSTNGGENDAFALKLNANGSALIYSTYLGGMYDDTGKGIGIDAAGNACITGQTISPNFPVAHALQPSMSDFQDAFVTRLNATGTALLYSTFLGGANADSGNAIAVDAAGNAYVTGATLSSDFPTANALQTGYRGRGAFTSSDGGSHWAVVGDAFPINRTITSVAIDPANSSVVYIGTDRYGVFKSTTGGGSWTASNNGIPDLSADGYPGLYRFTSDLEIDRNNPAILFVGIDGNGTFKSTNGGNSWSQGTGSGGNIASVKIDPTNSATIYSADYLHGLHRSTDGGQSWDEFGSLPTASTLVLAIAPTDPPTIYVGTNALGIFRFHGPGGAANVLFKPGVLALAVDPVTPTTVYAGTGVSGLYKSTDGGDNWSQINNGFPVNGGVPSLPVATSLAVDPQTPATVYAGTTFGLFKSTNGGGDWTALTVGLPATRIYDIGIDEHAVSHLYLGMAITNDVFVTKLNAAGSALLYSTYLGGLSGESGNGIAVDAAGRVYVAGSTASTDIQGVTSLRPFAGAGDAFVLKLNAAGGLGYFTYLGSSGLDHGSAIAVDSTGNAYVTGDTDATDFPTTPGAIPLAGGACANCIHTFVTSLNPAGTALLYSTYLGGNTLEPNAAGTLRDRSSALAVDPSGNMYVGGQNIATDFPVTSGAYDTSYNGAGDGFVAKFGAFDICMQDETNGNLLQINSTSGDYRFANCRKGLVYTGKGTVTVRGCKTTLTARAAGQTLTALVNTCSRVATAELITQGKSLTITDNDMANNTCACK